MGLEEVLKQLFLKYQALFLLVANQAYLASMQVNPLLVFYLLPNEKDHPL